MKNFWINKLKLWQVDDGERHWYSANSKEDAIKQHLEHFDLDDVEEIDVFQIPHDFILPVRDDCGDLIIKTAKQWCENGRGIVASTVY